MFSALLKQLLEVLVSQSVRNFIIDSKLGGQIKVLNPWQGHTQLKG